jgi:phosphomannomutase
MSSPYFFLENPMRLESISGIRGQVGNGFTTEEILPYVYAFHKLSPDGFFMVGRDSRPSGRDMLDIMIGTLNSLNRKVKNLQIVPTPTVQLIVELRKAAGGIVITASHNPIEWNGLKFIGPDGMFLDPNRMARLIDYSKSVSEFSNLQLEIPGNVEFYHHAIDDHIQKITEIPYLDIPLIRKNSFRVVIDCVNGAGYMAIPALLEYLGCEVECLNCQPDIPFPHPPEPLQQNLEELIERVKTCGADVGFAVDPDGDRLAVVDENGRYLVEEYTIVLAALLVLRKRKRGSSTVVTNLSTTMAMDDLAKKFDARIFRTPVGEIYVAKTMKETNAVIGGEGNGGVILPDVHYGRDSLCGIALILQLLAEEESPLSVIFDGLPQYYMVKERVSVVNPDRDILLDKLTEHYRQETINTEDGLKISWRDSWVHLRRSNTEPIIRIFAESGDRDYSRALAKRFVDEILALDHKST